MQIRSYATIPSFQLDAGSAADTPTAPTPASADEARNAKTLSALNQLRQSANSDKDAAADAAKKKLEALRQRLRTLMMMGGDPRAVAKEAAQIAKEIGAAAKAYAKASGGGVSPMASGAGPQPQSPTSNLDDGSLEGQAETSVPALAESPGSETDPAAPSDQNHGAASAESAAASDDPIVKDARKLANSAKELFKAAAEQARRQHKKGDLAEETRKVQGADQDLDDAGKALGSGVNADSYASSGLGGVAAKSPSEPTISISA
jgi:hypothetical protein